MMNSDDQSIDSVQKNDVNTLSASAANMENVKKTIPAEPSHHTFTGRSEDASSHMATCKMSIASRTPVVEQDRPERQQQEHTPTDNDADGKEMDDPGEAESSSNYSEGGEDHHDNDTLDLEENEGVDDDDATKKKINKAHEPKDLEGKHDSSASESNGSTDGEIMSRGHESDPGIEDTTEHSEASSRAHSRKTTEDANSHIARGGVGRHTLHKNRTFRKCATVVRLRNQLSSLLDINGLTGQGGLITKKDDISGNDGLEKMSSEELDYEIEILNDQIQEGNRVKLLWEIMVLIFYLVEFGIGFLTKRLSGWSSSESKQIHKYEKVLRNINRVYLLNREMNPLLELGMLVVSGAVMHAIAGGPGQNGRSKTSSRRKKHYSRHSGSQSRRRRRRNAKLHSSRRTRRIRKKQNVEKIDSEFSGPAENDHEATLSGIEILEEKKSAHSDSSNSSMLQSIQLNEDDIISSSDHTENSNGEVDDNSIISQSKSQGATNPLFDMKKMLPLVMESGILNQVMKVAMQSG